MAEKKKYNSILVSGRKDETLTYSKFIKDEESGESVKESLDKKVNVTDKLETQQIKDGAITNEKMAAGSVGNTNLQDGSVSNEKLEEGSITNEKLAVNSITKDKLKDNTIGVEKLDPELRQTINAATGLPENLVETIQNVDDTLKDHQSQLNDKQSQIDDKQQQITSNDEDISLLQTRSTQMEETIKSIAATGGASQATAVTYNNEKSKLTAVNIQSAVDEVVDKTAIKDEEGTLVETPFRYIQNEEFIFAKVDANDKLLFGIQWDATPVFGKTSAVEDRLQSQVTLLAERVATIMGDEDTTNVIDTMNELKKFFAEIENTETLTSILANLDKATIKDEEGNVQDTPFRVIENEEFIMAVVDSEDKVLFGIYRATGKPYYPQNDMYHISQSEEFLWVIIDSVNHPLLGIQKDGTCWASKAQWLDDIKAIKEALSSIDETLKTFQPKEDGKGLINLDVADSFFYISNDEYIIAVVDAENRILAGIKYDGEPYFPNNEMYSVITNEEWLYAIIDAENKVLGGFRADDGHMIVGSIDISTFIVNAIIDIQDIKERTNHLYTIENDEYLSVETDADGRVIGYIATDGSHYLYKVKSETIPTEFEHIEDPEGRTEITTDVEDKIIGYRDSEGTRHEKSLNVDKIQLGTQAAMYINKQAATKIRDFDLPKYGTVNIKEETFYLTSNVGYSDANGIYAVTINEDTDSNAQNGLSIQKFYVKSSLKDNGNGTYSVQEGSIPLDFYVPSKVKEVNGKYYVLSSLSELDGIYSVTDSSIEVTKITDKPTVGTWVVDKKTEHWCKVDIDFGHYLRGSFFIGVKYQGASTLYSRKRNFRFTFYTNSSYSKKNKKKIGEMIRTNSFNLKANYIDATRIKEAALYRIFIAMWEKRRKEYHNYPWRNSTTYYDCAVGMIKGFPISLSIGDDFYGIYIYGLKKDEKNYRLSDDSEGMFVSGDRSDSQCWIDGKPSDWSDEMNDEMTQSNIEALTKFLAFVNSTDFTKENVPTHLSVIDWIDYFIGMQVFVLKDSNCRNMILYSGSDKTLIYPFFYDLDNSFLFGIKDDIIETAWASDTSIWKKFISIYWDEIVTRYKELRENILTIEYVKKVFVSLEENIPVDDYSQESKKWGYASTNGISIILYNFSKRLEWLDNNYFV